MHEELRTILKEALELLDIIEQTPTNSTALLTLGKRLNTANGIYKEIRNDYTS